MNQLRRLAAIRSPIAPCAGLSRRSGLTGTRERICTSTPLRAPPSEDGVSSIPPPEHCWYPERDLHPHARRHDVLSVACLLFHHRGKLAPLGSIDLPSSA